MRKPSDIAIDRALLLYALQLLEKPEDEEAEEESPAAVLMSDVKVQQLAFLCELQMFAQGLRGFHYEYFRFAYGAYSKDLDNDLLALRKKDEGVETNQKILEIVKAIATTYGPQDSGAISRSVEAVEVSTPSEPDRRLPIRTISFHSTLLVPSRIEVKAEFAIPVPVLSRVSAALGG
ncbi:MAG: hypothetical protein HZB35_10610 [Nitrospirae bacterium]|nr:hypothetical protein [Nitrospirota bacterium]